MKKNFLLFVSLIICLGTSAQDYYGTEYDHSYVTKVQQLDSNTIEVETMNSRVGTSQNCYAFGDAYNYKNKIYIRATQKLRSISSSITDSSFRRLVVSDYTYNAYDSIMQDTVLAPYLCDTSSINYGCSWFNNVQPFDFYLDADSIYHILAYTRAYSEQLDYNFPYKIALFELNGKHDDLAGYATNYGPLNLLKYHVLDSAANAFTYYLPGGGPVIETSDLQTFYYNQVKNGVTKIDSQFTVTYTYNITYPQWNTDSTRFFSNLQLDSFGNKFCLYGKYFLYNQNKRDYDSIVPVLLIFNKNGMFENFTRYEDDEYLRRDVYAKKHGYTFYSSGNSTMVKYINASGDTIKSVMIPKLFSHDVIRVKNGYVDWKTVTDYNVPVTYLILSRFDSNGEFMKADTINYQLGSYYIVPEEMNGVSDSFDNIYLFYNYRYDAAANCQLKNFESPAFNIACINSVSGMITDSAGAKLWNVQVELILNGQSYYTTTNDSGRYYLYPCDTGHGLIVVHPGGAYTNILADTIPVVLSDTIAKPYANFLLRSRLTNIRSISKINTSLSPNPFSNYTTLSFDYDKPTALTILSVEGKIVQQYSSSGKNYLIYKKDLASGMYLYELRDKENSQILSNGKLTVE